MLKGKKGFMISTFGAPKEIYDKSGMTDGLKITSDTGIFHYVGIELVEHYFLEASVILMQKHIKAF
jgi:NAD(P)H dehydrogenase (quinone)